MLKRGMSVKKSKARELVLYALQREMGDQVTWGTEKWESCLPGTYRQGTQWLFSPQSSRASDSSCWGQREALEEQRAPHNRRRSCSRPSRVPESAQVHKSMESDEMHPWLLRKLVDEVAKPLTTKFEKLWEISEVPTE